MFLGGDIFLAAVCFFVLVFLDFFPVLVKNIVLWFAVVSGVRAQ